MSSPHVLQEHTSPSVIILCIIFNNSNRPKLRDMMVGKQIGLKDVCTALPESFGPM